MIDGSLINKKFHIPGFFSGGGCVPCLFTHICRHGIRARALLRSATGWFCKNASEEDLLKTRVHLLGILLSYSAPFILLARPSPVSCAVLRSEKATWSEQCRLRIDIRSWAVLLYIYFPRGGLGLSLSICYSAILTKTSRISRWKHFHFSISDRFASRYSKIFNNYRIFNHHGKHGLRWISPQSQLLICSGKIAL